MYQHSEFYYDFLAAFFNIHRESLCPAFKKVCWYFHKIETQINEQWVIQLLSSLCSGEKTLFSQRTDTFCFLAVPGTEPWVSWVCLTLDVPLLLCLFVLFWGHRQWCSGLTTLLHSGIMSVDAHGTMNDAGDWSQLHCMQSKFVPSVLSLQTLPMCFSYGCLPLLSQCHLGGGGKPRADWAPFWNSPIMGGLENMVFAESCGAHCRLTTSCRRQCISFW